MITKLHAFTNNVNQLPPRSYYIPFSIDDKKSYNRQDSSRFTLLNGLWNIKGYESFEDAENFLTDSFDKQIPVPSCVQYFGYDYFQYTNQRYPFALDVPNIPSINPTFHYNRTFSVNLDDKQNYYFVTEGVDSAYYLFINSNFVGFSNISHKVTEFDITKHLVNGENRVDILVVKWCAGSYLEDQDKWRFTGIFRDVYLLNRPKNHLTNYKIETDILNENEGLVKVSNLSNVDIEVEFNGEIKNIKSYKTCEFIVNNAIFWSAEQPYLYELCIKCLDEVIYEKIGICSSKIENGVYLFNNKPIKIRGVNRHDFHAEKGMAVSIEDAQADLKLLKSLNVNAIRTSHYPSCPEFYNLCNEYGFYVLSESDVEAHGGRFQCFDGDEKKALQIIPDYFADSILERNKFNYENNKNFTCVAIWSLGNESGWGKGFELSAKFFKDIDSRPIQYENIRCYNWPTLQNFHNDEFYKNCLLDFDSMMYSSPVWVTDYYLNGEFNPRPLIFCEYAHAMGNGPGGFNDYWSLFEENDNLTGGFVWELCNHGVSYNGKTERYGGDFNEFIHDANFCMDGIVNSDRSLKAGSLEMKKYYQPLKFTRNGDSITIFNKFYFINAVGLLTIEDNGNKENVRVCIEPRSEITLKCSKTGTVYLEFIKDGDDFVCAHEQFYDETFIKTNKNICNVNVIENARYVEITAGDYIYKIDKLTAQICNAKAYGSDFGSILINTWRAPIDNDRSFISAWELFGVRNPIINVKNVKIFDNTVEFNISLGKYAYCPFMNANLIYTFYENGVSVKINYTQLKTVPTNNSNFAITNNGTFHYIPRVGLKLTLDKSFDTVKFLANVGESYCDQDRYTIKGEKTSKIVDQYYNYYKPQETGSHNNADYVEVTNGEFVIRAEGMMSFSALPYSAEQITNAKHFDELPEVDGTYLSLDYFHSGLGSNSCGPMPSKDCRVPENGEGEIFISIYKK